MAMGARQVCSKLYRMLFLRVVALTFVVTPPGVLALTFTTIDVPGATFISPCLQAANETGRKGKSLC
jgi:hypothetical protein